jgi:hypothetical protein
VAVTLSGVRVTRAGWTSASFLLYAGGLISLAAAAIWLSVIQGEHGNGAFAGWSVLFYVLAEALAVRFLQQRRRLVAGIFAFVGVGLFAVMVGAFFSWFGWLPHDAPLHGFHVGLLLLELLVLMATFGALRIFKFPLLVLVAAPLSWYFVTDILSSGGNWSAWVTFLYGGFLFLIGLGIDAGGSREYGFWVHTTAGALVGGALLYWWHSSDFQWALICIFGVLFIFMGALIRRSSWTVFGAVGLVLATGHFALPQTVAVPVIGSTGGSNSTPWAGPVAYLCLGLFLAALGMLLYREPGDELP